MQPPKTSQPTKVEQGPQRKRKTENNEIEARESCQAQFGTVPGTRRQRKRKRISKTPEEVDKSVELIINECKSFLKAFINLDNDVKPLRKKLTTKENEFMDNLRGCQVAFKKYTDVLLDKEELDDTMRDKIISVLKKCDIDNESDLLVERKSLVSGKVLETFAENNENCMEQIKRSMDLKPNFEEKLEVFKLAGEKVNEELKAIERAFRLETNEIKDALDAYHAKKEEILNLITDLQKELGIHLACKKDLKSVLWKNFKKQIKTALYKESVYSKVLEAFNEKCTEIVALIIDLVEDFDVYADPMRIEKPKFYESWKHYEPKFLNSVLWQQSNICWAIALIRQLEGQYRLAGEEDENLSLSIQELVDTMPRCYLDLKKQGCLRREGYNCVGEFLMKHGTVEEKLKKLTYDVFPMSKKSTKAKRYRPTSVSRVAYEKYSKRAFEASLLEQLCLGPVAVAITITSSFSTLDGNKMYLPDVEEKGEDMGHLLLLTGYGTDEWGQDFWELQDSYGGDGFIRIARLENLITDFFIIRL